MPMQLNLSFDSFACPPLQIEEDTTILELKHTIELQTAIRAEDQELWFQNAKLSSDSATLRSAGVRNNDVIHIRERNQATVSQEEQQMLDRLNANPEALQMLPPELQTRIRAREPAAVAETMQFIQAQQAARQYEEIEALNADEFDPEAQAKIAERIKQQNIAANWEAALEHSPEIFGEIYMLYVAMEVNNKPLKVFVDSGAQACVMSLKCAEECNIAHLIDTRYQGILQGVGTQKMHGKVHSVQVKVGSEFVPMSVTIIEHSEVELLFGLDMLRRYRCNIDLDNNCLRFGTLGVSLPFLPDHEIPKKVPLAGSMAAGAPAASAGKHVPVAKSQPQGQAPVGGSSSSGAQPSASSLPGRAATGAPPTIDLTGDNPAAKTSTASQQPSGTGAASQAADQPQDMTEKVQQLMSLGFPQQMCEEALKMCGGSVEHAAAILFSQ